MGKSTLTIVYELESVMRNVEVVRLDPTLPECEKPADLRFPVRGAMPAVVGGKLVLCGGTTTATEVYNKNYTSEPIDACTEYDAAAHKWRYSRFKLTRPRHAHGATVTEDGEWIIAGGQTSETMRGGVFRDDRRGTHPADQPVIPADNPCLVPWNATHFFLSGESGSYLVKSEDDIWSKFKGWDRASLKSPLCGLVTKNGKREVLTTDGATTVIF